MTEKVLERLCLNTATWIRLLSRHYRSLRLPVCFSPSRCVDTHTQNQSKRIARVRSCNMPVQYCPNDVHAYDTNVSGVPQYSSGIRSHSEVLNFSVSGHTMLRTKKLVSMVFLAILLGSKLKSSFLSAVFLCLCMCVLVRVSLKSQERHVQKHFYKPTQAHTSILKSSFRRFKRCE